MAGVKGRSGQKAEKPWHEALKLAVNQRDADGVKLLRRLAERTVELALDGDMEAIKEIGNRLDGRPAQAVSFETSDGEDVLLALTSSFAVATLRAREAVAALNAPVIEGEAPKLLPRG